MMRTGPDNYVKEAAAKRQEKNRTGGVVCSSTMETFVGGCKEPVLPRGG